MGVSRPLVKRLTEAGSGHHPVQGPAAAHLVVARVSLLPWRHNLSAKPECRAGGLEPKAGFLFVFGLGIYFCFCFQNVNFALL